MRLNRLLRFVLLACWAVGSCSVQVRQKPKRRNLPTKSIHGHVVDARKKSIVGAKVFIRNVNKKTTTTLITDENGLLCDLWFGPQSGLRGSCRVRQICLRE